MLVVNNSDQLPASVLAPELATVPCGAASPAHAPVQRACARLILRLQSRPSNLPSSPPHFAMDGKPWIQANNSGWGAYDAHNDDAHRAASWLADSHQSSLPTPRFYDDDKLHSSWLHRFQVFRKSLLRRLPSVDSLFQSDRVSLTNAPPSTSFSAPSPDTVRFVLLCGLWYLSSALSSNTGKAIMNDFRFPVTLTFVQFGFVAAYCLLFLSPAVQFSTLRRPTKEILKSTFPMGCFQVGGHIFSSMAISRIPVSTVHTIKVSTVVCFISRLFVAGMVTRSRAAVARWIRARLGHLSPYS